MNDSTTIEWLSKAIAEATRSATYCVTGCLPAVDPAIEIKGLGPIRLPLEETVAKALVERCSVAPYGKGTRTLVNTGVRNTFELDPAKFHLAAEWNTAIVDATESVAQELGLPPEELEARLYKLLIYEEGGFFLAHRDSEKQNGMVASMIVVLPNPFQGGTLVVRHGQENRAVHFEEAAHGKLPCYAAFYADCKHQVERVAGGVRLALAYNLVLNPKRSKPSAVVKSAGPSDLLADSISSWVASQPATPLVFALEHHYTEHGLSLELLKGADRLLADLVVTAAEKTDCVSHLAQVSRHLLQHADDGRFGRHYWRHEKVPVHRLEIGETYEDDLSGKEWTDLHGKKQPFGTIAFPLSAIVSEEPLADWQPTSEEYEGYTGNAGNTLDRWYHRTALVLWHRDHHFDLIATAGPDESIPLFCSMTAKLAKAPKKKLAEARAECNRFARAIISVWPRQRMPHSDSETPAKSQSDDFQESLLALHDPDTIAMYLSKLAGLDPTPRVSAFLVAACREFGWNAFASELTSLISSPPDPYGGPQVAFRDMEWLSAFCCDKTVDADKTALAHELCAIAARRFCEPFPPRRGQSPSLYRRPTSISEASLPFLVQAIAATCRDEDLSRVIDFVQKSPDEFRLDECQVPALKSLIPWSHEQLGSVHPQLASWLASVRRELELATAARPAAPADWARPAELSCTCQFCRQLRDFLADRANPVARIPAREDVRHHLLNIIDRHQCDVDRSLDRKGRPFALVLQKTLGSFERAVSRFEQDLRLLSELPH